MMDRFEHASIYDLIGGQETIDKLVEAFYPKVYAHPELIPLFPDGVEDIKGKQRLFLSQFTGGPTLYTDKFGFGNMRMIHARFPITKARANAWLECMNEAMDEIELEGVGRERLFGNLVLAAHRFVNTETEE